MAKDKIHVKKPTEGKHIAPRKKSLIILFSYKNLNA